MLLNEFLCIGQVTNEKKILGILMKQNLKRKIARLDLFIRKQLLD